MTVRRRYAAVSVVAVVALLAGCGSAGGGAGTGTATAAKLADTITVGIQQAPDSYNSNTADTNSVYNAYVDNLTQPQFATIQPDGTVKANKAFGSYKKTSDDPLTVKYTFADKAMWSDGTPLDYDDVLLTWAAFSGTHPSGTKDADGNPVDLFNAASTNGWAGVAMPEGKAGDKSFTFVFKTPYADWETLADYFMPAHIAAEKGGLSAAGNGAALITAIKDNNTAALKPVADFWNTGWAYQANLPKLPDLALIPSIGPYKYDNAANGTLTLVRNDKWWGPAAKTKKIVFKTVDANEMVQALQNGEIDSFDPSNPNADTLSQLKALGGAVKVKKGESMAFSHIDLDSSKTGVFADLRVRQAFLKCVPRQDLVDKFAKPIYPAATVLDLHEYLPSQAQYTAVLAKVPTAKKYAKVDLTGAKALLTAAGVKMPLTVRLTFPEQQSVRADQAALVKASCDQAGFDIQAKPDPQVFATISQLGGWDAAVFSWAGSGLVASGQSIYITGGEQNIGKFSDPIVDDLWTKIVQVTDPADAVPLKAKLEEELWAKAYNVLLFANPGITAFSSALSGPGYNPTQTGSTWNAETWTKSLS